MNPDRNPGAGQRPRTESERLLAQCREAFLRQTGDAFLPGPELIARSGQASLEDAFVHLLGSGEGLAA